MATPIHLVAGADDDPVDRQFLRRLSECHPHLSLEMWPGAGHELPLTHPVACVGEIERLCTDLRGEPAG